MNKKEIGEMIRVRRISRGMTQDDLACETLLAQSTIAGYESGARRPSRTAAEALADAFNVPVWSIYYREDEVVPADEAAVKTTEGRIISAGIDRMPPEERKRAVQLFELTFGKKYFEEDDEK